MAALVHVQAELSLVVLVEKELSGTSREGGGRARCFARSARKWWQLRWLGTLEG